MAREPKTSADKRTVVPNGTRIRELRQQAGYSLEEFAEKSGISTGTLGPVERDNKPIFVKKLHEIVEALNRTKKVQTTYQELVLPENLPPNSSQARVVPRIREATPGFIGREAELAQIAVHLRGRSASVGLSSALRGMGGIGKTETAIKACQESKDSFPDGQLMVELRGQSEPLTPAQAMAQVIRNFGCELEKLPDDENALQMLYWRVLEGKKALLLFDDARDDAQVRPLLGVRGIVFVVTSRSALELTDLSIPLDVLPEGEAFVLLRRLIGTKGTDDEVKRVAELCGHLPLALRVAGDFLRLHDNWPLPKYIGRLQDETKRLEQLKGKSLDRDVKAVLATSASELVRENTERAERWQWLSVFPSDFDAQAAAAVWDLMKDGELDTETADDELTTLLDRSLVLYDADTDRYALHDLIRPIARTVFESDPDHPNANQAAVRLEQAALRHACHYAEILIESPGAVTQALGEQLWRKLGHNLDSFPAEPTPQVAENQNVPLPATATYPRVRSINLDLLNAPQPEAAAFAKRLKSDVLNIQAVGKRYLASATSIEQNKELAIGVGLGMLDLLAGAVDRAEVERSQKPKDPELDTSLADACLLLATMLNAMSAHTEALNYARRARAIYTTTNPSKLPEVDALIGIVNQQLLAVSSPESP